MKGSDLKHYVFLGLLCGGATGAYGQSRLVSPPAASGLVPTPVKVNRTVPNVTDRKRNATAARAVRFEEHPISPYSPCITA